MFCSIFIDLFEQGFAFQYMSRGVSIDRPTIGVVGAPCALYRLRHSEAALGGRSSLYGGFDAPLTGNDDLKSFRFPV